MYLRWSRAKATRGRGGAHEARGLVHPSYAHIAERETDLVVVACLVGVGHVGKLLGPVDGRDAEYVLSVTVGARWRGAV